MYSAKLGMIFVHIPKTAGQSIEMALLDHLGLPWKARGPLLLRVNHDRRLGPERLAHLKALEYVSCGYVPPAQFDAAFKFCFVRNPWDRLFSEYNSRRNLRRTSFREFVLHGFPKANTFSDAYRHLLPQSDYVFGEDGSNLCDFVGRFETLNRDFRIVTEKLGLPPIVLRHRNQSVADLKQQSDGTYLRYQDFYDPETKAFVEDFYSRDIAAFGYSFET